MPVTAAMTRAAITGPHGQITKAHPASRAVSGMSIYSPGRASLLRLSLGDVEGSERV